MVASRPVTLDASAPEWAKRLVADMEKGYVKAYPTAPVRLPAFVSTDLPKASDYPWCLIAVTDTGVAAMSNGTAWVNTDGSAL